MLGSKYFQALCACLLNAKQRLLELASKKKRIQTSYHKALSKKLTYLNLCRIFLNANLFLAVSTLRQAWESVSSDDSIELLFFRWLGKGFQEIQNYWNNKVKEERSHYFNG